MVWLIAGGIVVLAVIAAACGWAVIALLVEVGEEQEAAADDFEFDSANEPRRGHWRVARH
jgi:hypothetical protein